MPLNITENKPRKENEISCELMFLSRACLLTEMTAAFRRTIYPVYTLRIPCFANPSMWGEHLRTKLHLQTHLGNAMADRSREAELAMPSLQIQLIFATVSYEQTQPVLKGNRKGQWTLVATFIISGLGDSRGLKCIKCYVIWTCFHIASQGI